MTKLIRFRPARVRLAGAFENPENLSAAAQSCASRGFQVLETYSSVPMVSYTPPVVNVPSRLTFWGLGAALVTLPASLWFCSWASSVDWPLNVRAMPVNSLVAFLPVVFEVTILLAAIVPAAVFLFGLLSRNQVNLDEFVANDCFVLLVEGESSRARRTELFSLFEEHQACAVREVAEIS